MAVVGLLRNTPSASFEHIVAALSRGLGEAGFVDGRNIVIEQRWAEGRDDRLPALLADLIGRKAGVLSRLWHIAELVGGPAHGARHATDEVGTGSLLLRY